FNRAFTMCKHMKALSGPIGLFEVNGADAWGRIGFHQVNYQSRQQPMDQTQLVFIAVTVAYDQRIRFKGYQVPQDLAKIISLMPKTEFNYFVAQVPYLHRLV